jgi:putative transposase
VVLEQDLVKKSKTFQKQRFNRTYSQDILDAHLFEEISQVRILTEEWIKDYNQERPHEGLGGMTPEGYEQAYLVPDLILLKEENVV